MGIYLPWIRSHSTFSVVCDGRRVSQRKRTSWYAGVRNAGLTHKIRKRGVATPRNFYGCD